MGFSLSSKPNRGKGAGSPLSIFDWFLLETKGIAESIQIVLPTTCLHMQLPALLGAYLFRSYIQQVERNSETGQGTQADLQGSQSQEVYCCLMLIFPFPIGGNPHLGTKKGKD